MRTNPALTPSADTERPMPTGAAARLDAIDNALHSLTGERRRLERLGFELPLARCEHQIRYWKFVHGVFSIAACAGERRMVRS